MKKTLIFFSNDDSLSDIKIYSESGIINNKIKHYKEITGDKKILIVCDEIEIKSLEPFIDISNETIFIHHRKPVSSKRKELTNLGAIAIKDNHRIKRYYKYLYEVFDVNGNFKTLTEQDFDRIWSRIFNFELEESLEFLNELNKGSDPELSDNIIKHEDEYSKFKKTVKGEIDVFSDKYVIALTKLRKAILGSIKL